MPVEELPVGPELDRAVSEVMGGTTARYYIHRADGTRIGSVAWTSRVSAEKWAQLEPGRSVTAEYPPYSTTDEGMGQVLDWLVQQGSTHQHFANYPACGEVSFTCYHRYEPVSGRGATRAEAVCRAVLKLRGADSK